MLGSGRSKQTKPNSGNAHRVIMNYLQGGVTWTSVQFFPFAGDFSLATGVACHATGTRAKKLVSTRFCIKEEYYTCDAKSETRTSIQRQRRLWLKGPSQSRGRESSGCGCRFVSGNWSQRARHQSKWKHSLLQTSENRTCLLIPLLNDSFPTEDLGSVNRKWAVKYLQVQGPGFYRLWGPFKRMTVNFPTSRGDFSEVR